MTLTVPDVEPKARVNAHGLTSEFYGSADDPTHRQAWAAVSEGRVDRAVVRDRDGYVLFRAWRISEKSWAWQSSSMAAMAFMPYEGVQA